MLVMVQQVCHDTAANAVHRCQSRRGSLSAMARVLPDHGFQPLAQAPGGCGDLLLAAPVGFNGQSPPQLFFPFGETLGDALNAGQWTVFRSAATVSPVRQDRKSTRLNSSHVKSSYAVCCL